MPKTPSKNPSLPPPESFSTLISSRRLRVFGSADFPGNPTTIHAISAFPADAELLAHSRSLATVDNAYYLQAAAHGVFEVKCYSHTAPLQVCGHALLATGHHLLATTGLAALRLDTPAFTHQVMRSSTGSTWLSLPRHTARPVDDPALVDKLLTATGLTKSQLESARVSAYNVYVLSVTVQRVLEDFQPAACAWHTLDELAPGALILSCAVDGGAYAFRYFSPWWGKPEDSATGSAHSFLAPLWLAEGTDGLEGMAVETRQCSPAGPALAQVLLEPDRVWISGRVDY